jgi:hypothetical protein
MFRIAIAFLFLAGSTSAWCSVLKGTLTVKVIDEKGQPVPGATVEMNPPPDKMLLYSRPECTTDSSGVCSRDDLLFDTYYVTAMKPSVGYPDLSFNIYSHRKKPIIVELSSKNTKAEVSFKIGPKCGFLTINAVDSGTGGPVIDRAIVLRNPSDPKDVIGIGRTSDPWVLIPPDEDIQIEVVAEGYQPWSSTKHAEQNGGKPMRLHSEERREMTIRMLHQ